MTTTDFRDRLAHSLIAVREGAGISQSVAARRLGITQAALSNYENGRRTPDIERLVDIARLYGVSLEMLVE